MPRKKPEHAYALERDAYPDTFSFLLGSVTVTHAMYVAVLSMCC